MLDCTHSNSEIEKRLEGIYALHTKKMDFRLDKGPYIELLANIGNPHLNLPPVIHVAGTNGKGSTIAFMQSILEEFGLKVHTYTSPHLLQFNERITLAGSYISDDQLIEYMDLIDEANNGASITFFEYTTALAFKAMSDVNADICLIETGLGGRLDCTNVIKQPIATVITSIGHDHTEWLGNDIKKIAWEKAGIMKGGVPCFISPQTYKINDVFIDRANDLNCQLYFVDEHENLPELGLFGDHQKQNASTALATLSFVFPKIKKEEINRGLSATKWPARMEKITSGALFDQLPENSELWFDCGHNSEGAKAIGIQLQKWKDKKPSREIHVILGLGSDKDPNEFLAPMVDFIDSLTCVDLLNARNPQSGEELKEKIDLLTKYYTYGNINEVISNLKDDNIILITGSLYLYEYTINRTI